MAIAEHHPDEVYSQNRGVLSMDKEDLHDFAATKESNLPLKKKKRKFTMS
jgi:hypothetical protein